MIVTADDFGRSSSINEAVVQAHRGGILTAASLMVNEAACAEAVGLARTQPRLGVGLHLTLTGGHAALSSEEAPGLVNAGGEFDARPVRAGWRYFFRPGLREALRREIDAQFERFRETGLRLDHVNGHLNLHLHPTVLRLLAERASRDPFPGFRLTRDPFWLNAHLASGDWAYRLSHAIIFGLLCAWARQGLRRHRVRHTGAVFGLLQSGRVDAQFVLRLLPRLPTGDSELYCHPSVTDFQSELEALVDPRVRDAVRDLNIQLIRYQDL